METTKGKQRVGASRRQEFSFLRALPTLLAQVTTFIIIVIPQIFVMIGTGLVCFLKALLPGIRRGTRYSSNSNGTSSSTNSSGSRDRLEGSFSQGMMVTTPQTFLGSVVAQLALFLMCGCMQVVLILSYYTLYSLIAHGSTRWSALFLGALISDFILPSRSAFSQDVTFLQLPLVTWVLEKMREYFDMECIIEQTLDPHKNYMFAQFPHGIYPVSTLLASKFLSKTIPGEPKVYCLIASMLFHFPFFKRLYREVGGVAANRENLERIKNLPNPASCTIVVGGLAEMFLISEEEEAVFIRKGFIREAISHGYDLIPVYHFGNTRMFKSIGPSWLQEACRKWARTSRGPLIFFRGRYNSWIPYRKKLVTVVGSPIEVKQRSKPTDEQVEETLKKFQSELERIYYQYRPDWETRPLSFVDDLGKITTTPPVKGGGRGVGGERKSKHKHKPYTLKNFIESPTQ